MPDSTQDAGSDPSKMHDRDPDEGWLAEAVRARTLAELRAVARANGPLVQRDQAWCRALAAHLADVDAAAMRELTHQLGAIPVTGDGSGS